MKVLQGTKEIGNQMNTISNGLNELGVLCRTLTYSSNYLNYKSDLVLDLKDKNNSTKLEALITRLMSEYDVFHFHFGKSLQRNNSDLPILKEIGKKVFMQHWGTDVRCYSQAVKRNPYVQVKTHNEEKIKRRLSMLSTYVENCIVSDYELYEDVKEHYSKIHVVPQSIDLSRYKVSRAPQNKKMLIVHAPTSPLVKGTSLINKALEDLKNKYDFEFRLIQGMSHKEAMKIYRKADLIVDQILIGSYGLLSTECMALGKPVICWISEFMKDKYPVNLPIISANPDNIKRVLSKLMRNKDGLQEIGKKGRAYAEEHHDMRINCKKIMDIYLSK